MDYKSRYAVNMVFQYSGTILELGLGIISVPFLLGILGMEMFGLTALFTSIFGIAQLMELGLGVTLGRFLSVELTKGDSLRYNQYFSSAIIIGTSVFVVLFFGFACFAELILVLCRVPEAYMEEAISAFRINMVYSGIVSFILPVIRAVYVSKHRFDLISVIFSGLRILQVLGWFLLLSFLPQSQIFGWSIVNFLAGVAIFIFSYVGACKIFPELSLRLKFFDISAVKDMYSVAWKVFIDRFMGFSEVTVNPIILPVFGSLTLNAIYKPAMQAVSVVVAFLMQASAPVMPYSAEAFARNDMGKIAKAYMLLLRFVFLIGIMGCVFFFFYAAPIFDLWVGKELGDKIPIAVNSFLILLFAQVLSTSSALQTPLLVGINRLNFMAACSIIRTVIGLASSIMLLAYTDFGVYAVVLPVSILKVATCVAQSLYIARLIGLKRFEQLKGAYASCAFSAAIYFGVVLLQTTLLERQNVFINFVLSAFISLPIMWFLGLGTEGRGYVRLILERLWNKAFPHRC